MNGDELDRGLDPELEAELRAELRRAIVPPPTPQHVYDGVDRLALAALAPRTRRGFLTRLARRPALAGLAAAAVVALLVAGSVLVRSSIVPGPVGTASPRPIASPLPSGGPPANLQSSSASLGAWIDGHMLYVGVGDGKFRLSDDGGATWSAVRSVPQAADSDLQFVDREHAWSVATTARDAAGRIVAYRSGDGGRTWTQTVIGTVAVPAGGYLQAWVHFADTSRGVVLSRIQLAGGGATPSFAACRVYTTDDGGTTWSDPSAAPCFGMTWPAWDSPLFGGALDVSRAPTVSEDGGRTWRTLTVPAVGAEALSVMVVQQVGPGHLRLIGQLRQGSTIPDPTRLARFESEDGGASWHETGLTAPLPSGEELSGIAPIAGDHWHVLLRRSELPGIADLVETHDAGGTWTAVGMTALSIGGKDVELGPVSGLVTGFGTMWWGDELHGVVQADYMDCSAGNECSGVAVGDYITRDGGLTWSYLDPH